MESISERLSNLDTLYFPRALQSSATTPSDRKSLLLDLLSRDVAVFLERYGSQLTPEELNEFSVLKDDYEINWHVNHLRALISPTADELKSKSAKIKNRRLAFMDKLVIAGHYFSEDAMREREPYLHHEYVGKFQDPCGRNMARPGERWSETLMRRSEEAILVAKIRGEQQRLGVAESDWVGNEREQQPEEEEEDEEEEEEEFGAAVGTSHPAQVRHLFQLRSVFLNAFAKHRILNPGLGNRVVGTLFGHKRCHVHFAFQKDANSPPAFLVELATPISELVREMASGLVRIALECNKKETRLASEEESEKNLF